MTNSRRTSRGLVLLMPGPDTGRLRNTALRAINILGMPSLRQPSNTHASKDTIILPWISCTAVQRLLQYYNRTLNTYFFSTHQVSLLWTSDAILASENTNILIKHISMCPTGLNPMIFIPCNLAIFVANITAPRWFEEKWSARHYHLEICASSSANSAQKYQDSF